MALILTEEQMMVRDNARAFLADKAPVAHLRKLRDSARRRRVLAPAVEGVRRDGILRPARCPRVWAGSGLGYVEAGVIMEEIGRNLTPSPFLSTALLGATALLRDGNGARNKELLPKLAAGDLLLALAVDERTQARAQRDRAARRSAAATVLRSPARNASSSTATSPTFSSSRRAAPARRARPTASRSFSSTPRRRASTPSAP